MAPSTNAAVAAVAPLKARGPTHDVAGLENEDLGEVARKVYQPEKSERRIEKLADEVTAQGTDITCLGARIFELALAISGLETSVEAAMKAREVGHATCLLDSHTGRYTRVNAGGRNRLHMHPPLARKASSDMEDDDWANESLSLSSL